MTQRGDGRTGGASQGIRMVVFQNVPWAASLAQAQGAIQGPVGRIQLAVPTWEPPVYRTRCSDARNVIFSEQCRVGRAVAQNKALETRMRERRRGKARDAGRCPGTRGALLPTFSQRLFLIKYMGEKSCKLRLVLKSIQWGGQEEVTSHRSQQSDAGRRWSN